MLAVSTEAQHRELKKAVVVTLVYLAKQLVIIYLHEKSVFFYFSRAEH